MTLSRAAAFSRWTGSAGGGRCKRARRQHFSTDIKHAANAAGVGYGVLGPKGAYLNPCEMVFERLKCLLADWTPSTGPVRYDSFGCVICGPQDWNEFQCAMTEAVQKLNANKKLLRSFFHDRCEGYGFERRWAGTPIFEEVEPNVKPFDLAKKLLRPVMSVRDESPPETRAQAASYAQWWLANSRFPEMVPDGPVPGPACALDQFGEEKLCRACGKGTGRKDPQEGDALLRPGMHRLVALEVPGHLSGPTLPPRRLVLPYLRAGAGQEELAAVAGRAALQARRGRQAEGQPAGVI